MDKAYIPNIIRDLIKKHLSEMWHDPHPYLNMVKVTWEPISLKELKQQNEYVKKQKKFNNVCYAGELTLKTDFANTPIRYSGAGNPIFGGDYRMMFGERFDKILAELTKLLDNVVYLPYKGEMDDSSHGPISFRQIDNTYTLKQEFDRPNEYKAIFGLILHKDYLQI
jgi:hypothetical protein